MDLIHTCYRVTDPERSIAFYRTALGLDVADRYDFDSFTLVYLRNQEADFEVELTLNKGRAEPYDLGDGYGHVAFCVEDLDGEHRIRPAGEVTDHGQCEAGEHGGADDAVRGHVAPPHRAQPRVLLDHLLHVTGVDPHHSDDREEHGDRRHEDQQARAPVQREDGDRCEEHEHGSGGQ